MRNFTPYLLGAALGVCLILAIVPRSGAQSLPGPKVSILQKPKPPRAAVKVDDGGGSALPGPWRRAKASWYTGPTDRTADGTRMRLDGLWVATRLVPMGAKIEVRNKRGKTWILPRRDTPDPRFGHRLDLPASTWKTVTGAKQLSTGLVEIEWRQVR